MDLIIAELEADKPPLLVCPSRAYWEHLTNWLIDNYKLKYKPIYTNTPGQLRGLSHRIVFVCEHSYETFYLNPAWHHTLYRRHTVVIVKESNDYGYTFHMSPEYP